ncbi:SpnB-like Rossmann fold domain-containing protein, partial [Streptomyces sp. MMG1121]|uniref:SpnB-like Rossmann fold domain-containing protein n=1 Tax=Streptomyces sp. MMG1121 TaxID=1415544 RepID=UPI0006C0FC67
AVAAEGVEDLAAAAVWGLVRSAQSENPDRFVLVDVDGTAQSWAALSAAVGAGESQMAVRVGEVVVPRLVRADGRGVLSLAEGVGSGWRLDVAAAGTLESLALVPFEEGERRALAAGEVRIAVRAAGLNFRDVLIALGMYPGEA